MATMVLDSVLDLKAAGPLKAALTEHRGEDVQIDASDVQRLGGLCLQLLLAARRTWNEDGRAFLIEPRSEPFTAALTLFGANERLVGAERQGETQ